MILAGGSRWFQLHDFVLMPEHVHLLLTSGADITQDSDSTAGPQRLKPRKTVPFWHDLKSCPSRSCCFPVASFLFVPLPGRAASRLRPSCLFRFPVLLL